MNIEKLRQDFPILQHGFKGKPVIYFDNACMSLKPKQVVEAVNDYYYNFPACGGRSHHKLAQKVTEEVENTRKLVAKFINAKQDEIVFTKNTTESINLLSYSLVDSLEFKEGDMILTSDKEHNSNLIPWLRAAKRKNLKHDVFEFGNLDDFEEKIKNNNVRIAGFVHTSNLDGTENPIKEMLKIAKENNVLTIVDGAQTVPHKEINVKKLGCDFLAFSGHKMLGPTGIGCLYGKFDLLSKLPQFITGGETVNDSTYDSYQMASTPHRLEGGLQHYSGIIGLGAAVKYLDKVGMSNIQKHEINLNKFVTEKLNDLIINGKIKLIGPDAEKRSGIFSFFLPKQDIHETAMMLDHSANIMLRSGAHCCHSWFNKHKLKGSVRASLYLYNTEEECEKFVEAISKIIRIV